VAGFLFFFIQFFNATLGYKEITSAGDAVAALKKTLQARAEVFRDGRWCVVSATEVVPGDMVKLASGSAIPADCRRARALSTQGVLGIAVDESSYPEIACIIRFGIALTRQEEKTPAQGLLSCCLPKTNSEV
jgi:magnesium-transporting ATPase (P-type)